MQKDKVLDELRKSMTSLYTARYMVTGPLLNPSDFDKKHYPEMDVELFDDIVHIQTALQRLISKVSNDRPN